jgi:biotin transport system substrate-specific component
MSTLAEALVPRSRTQARVVVHLVAALAGSLLVAALAQLSIRLPFTPVPITGQTLGVLLVGASLGPAWGAGSMLLYLAEGAVGLPFYAEGNHGVSLLKLSSATGGYLWGFVLAAVAVGWLSRLGWDRSIRSSIGAMLIGEIVLYAVGVPWLVVALNLPLEKGLELGLYPFVIGDTLKLLTAAALVPGAWALIPKSRR